MRGATMVNKIPVFKSWVPEWMIRAVIFIVVLPSMALFGLSTANGAAATGYYGIEPADVQYSMIVFYAAVASFFALERRFFSSLLLSSIWLSLPLFRRLRRIYAIKRITCMCCLYFASCRGWLMPL